MHRTVITTFAVNTIRATAVKPESTASSQTGVRELSTLAHHRYGTRFWDLLIVCQTKGDQILIWPLDCIRVGPQMKNGRKYQGGGTTRDIPEIPNQRFCAHTKNGGEKSLHGRVLWRHPQAFSMVLAQRKPGRRCSTYYGMADSRVFSLCGWYYPSLGAQW